MTRRKHSKGPGLQAGRRWPLAVLGTLAVALLTTGCWNRRELNELAIASSMGFDVVKGGVTITVQVIDPGEISNKAGGGSAGRAPVTLYDAHEDTVFQAIRSITTKSPRKIYLSHLRIVVISEELARKGIRNIIDFLSRDHELRRDFYILIARGKASDVLNTLTTIEKIPANKMFNSVKVAEESWGPVLGTNLEDLIGKLVRPGIAPLVPGIRIIGNKEQGSKKSNVERIASPARLNIGGLAIFHKDKLLGWLNEKEGVGANFILNKMKSTVVAASCPGGTGKLGAEVIRSESSMKASNQGDNPLIVIEVRSEANVADVECSLDLTKKETIKELETSLNDEIRGMIDGAIRAAQKKFKSDAFGFGDTIRRKKPELWARLEDQWNEIYPTVPYEIRVETKLRRTGTMSQSFIEEIKE
ncbi:MULTISPECIES: Ger(x)C family spore germination protein [Paenibacillus]|uniref:Ger(x)C family spore germination protein n=1 Tax=Paenibacillus TaxID=44249 RepID=UPI0022B88977|nr:Ger(x)C family spore germination protein [Paenibacillus caseinilyticus]MCZ8522605.1 Ger(x)C family spore germination protein [Paenibacillus caseinilyticus]